MNCKKIKRQYIKAEAATVKPVTFTLPHKLSTQRQKGKLMKFIFSLNNIVPCILPPFSAPSFFFLFVCVLLLCYYTVSSIRFVRYFSRRIFLVIYFPFAISSIFRLFVAEMWCFFLSHVDIRLKFRPNFPHRQHHHHRCRQYSGVR